MPQNTPHIESLTGNARAFAESIYGPSNLSYLIQCAEEDNPAEYNLEVFMLLLKDFNITPVEFFKAIHAVISDLKLNQERPRTPSPTSVAAATLFYTPVYTIQDDNIFDVVAAGATLSKRKSSSPESGNSPISQDDIFNVSP